MGHEGITVSTHLLRTRQIRFGSAITHCQIFAILSAILSAVLAKENRAESHSTQDMLATPTVEERINNNLNIEYRTLVFLFICESIKDRP